MSRPTRDGTAEPFSRDQILRHVRGQGDIHFPQSADHEQDWQPYLVDPYSAICDDHTYIHTYYVYVIIGMFRNWLKKYQESIVLSRTVKGFWISQTVWFSVALAFYLSLGKATKRSSSYDGVLN